MNVGWFLTGLVGVPFAWALLYGFVALRRRGVGDPRECGHWNERTRRQLVLRTVTPHGSRWDRLLCRLFTHQLACCPNHATFIYTPDGSLSGMMCERCGGLNGQPNPKEGR